MSQLTPVPITPPPGVVKTESSRIIEGRWIDCDKIRFKQQRPQKIGGWTIQTATPTLGLPRTMLNWRDLSANNYIAVGTNLKLYVYDTLLAQNDITPFRSTGTMPNDPFTTDVGSSIVTVNQSGHGVTQGDTIIFSGATAIDGITPNGTFTVATVIDSNSYTFDSGTVASGTATGGGNAVLFSYEINIGSQLSSFGFGWGVGGWGLDTWGTARTGSTPSVVIEPRVWSLDHFGKILLATYNSGSIYTFDPTVVQPWGRAQIIATAPTDTRSLVVTPERFVFALRDNMILSSCSQSDYNTWTPASSNTAFSRTLTVGGRLVAGRVLAPFVTLVWSDAALYTFQYTGSQFVYNSSLVAIDCGLVGPNAAVAVQGIAYWMGPDNFWMYNGSVVQMPNAADVRHFVFKTLPNNTSFQCFAVYNSSYNEIFFGYADGSQIYPTRYLIYDITDQIWATGTMTRVSGSHFTQGDTRPYFADADGFIYLHEDGNNDNGSPLPWSLTMAPMAIQEGYHNVDVEGIIFDFFEQSGDITATINTYDRLNDATLMDTETETVPQVGSPYIDYRASGRYIGLVLSQNGLDTYFRLGKPAVFIRQTGRRP